jgi:hypothetical protein
VSERTAGGGGRVAGFAATLVTLSVLGAAVLPALAHDQDQLDRNDTEGRLDVRSVEHAHENLPRMWTVITFRGWTTRRIWDAGYVVVFLDTFAAEDADYYALLRSNRRRMTGTLWRIRDNGINRQIARVRARRPNRSSVRVAIPFGRLNVGESRVSYSWSVLTIYQSGACPRNCFDFVPNNGLVEQPYPTPSPSPSTTGAPIGGSEEGSRGTKNDRPVGEYSPATSSSPLPSPPTPST